MLPAPRAAGAHLLFAYRLTDAAPETSFALEGIDRAALYSVKKGLDGGCRTASGAELIDGGITVDLPDACSAEVFVVEPE